MFSLEPSYQACRGGTVPTPILQMKKMEAHSNRGDDSQIWLIIRVTWQLLENMDFWASFQIS